MESELFNIAGPGVTRMISRYSERRGVRPRFLLVSSNTYALLRVSLRADFLLRAHGTALTRVPFSGRGPATYMGLHIVVVPGLRETSVAGEPDDDVVDLYTRCGWSGGGARCVGEAFAAGLCKFHHDSRVSPEARAYWGDLLEIWQ